MSRVFDLNGNQYHLEEVQRHCLEQLNKFVRGKGVFGWPMDRISNQPYGYTIHVSIVEDWNKENRETDCIEFHRKWLSNLDNIKKSIERCHS